MKFLKKAVSALLASVMCIPSGILSFASAEEENQVTTVTLSDTENGLMQFSEDCMAASTASQDGYHMMQVNENGELEQIENDGSVWAFNYGDLVEVELLPDEGFHVKSFTVSDSESGDVLAETETQDNVFSFTMPQSSVIVDVIFDDGSGSSSNEPDSDNDESENHKEPDNASGNGETEPEGAQEQDKGAQNQNQLSEEADVPVSAAADKVSSLQKEIDSLPDAIDYATGEVAGMGEEKVKELEEKVKRLKRAYFEEITDEQADQINPAKLYGSLIMMEYMNSEGNTRYTPDAQKTEELQERINSLDHVFGIAFPIDVESSYIFMAYNDGNTEAQVSNKEMRQKFLDTLNLVHEMQMVDEAYADENIDSEFLIQMRAFFTTGVGIMLDEVMPLTAGGDPKDWWKDSAESGGVTLTGTYSQDYSKDAYSPVSGSYKSLGHNEYGGNNWNTEVTMKNNSTGKNEKFNAVAYCGNADWHVDAARENGRVYFDAGRIAKLIESRGAAIITPKGQLKSPADFATYLGNDKYKNDKYTKKDEENRWAESGRGILMRLILWYGKEGPGYGQDGMPQPSYAATHTALSYLYSQQLGTKWGGMGINDENWTNFYKACVKKYADAAPSGIKDFKNSADGKISDGKLANGADVTFESFCVYVICPSNKDQEWQHIFFFCADGGDESNPDPICLALVKKPAKEFRENEALAADAKLAGAKYKVDFYPNLTAKSAKNIPKDLSPKCSWTFTTSKSETRGSKFYKRFMTKVNDGLTGNTIPIAGIDFGPESGDMTQDRDKWKNEFIDANDLKTWRENFGKDGAYHIYEVEPPKGFGLGGKIEDKGGTGTSVEDGSRGIVIRIKGDLTKNSIEDGKAAIFVEGKEIKKSGYIELEGEKDSKTFSAALLHAETNNTWEVKSTAAVVSTGGHKAEPDSGEIEVKDTIVITPKEQDDSTYIASVKLYDKTDDKYIDVTWTPAANQEVDGKAIVHKQKLGSGEKKIKFTVNGKISTDGMADHELVFIAEVKAKNGSETSESVKTSKDDTAEMITFGKEPSEPGTSIAHNEIQRKAGTGEAIAKAEAGQSLTDKITYSGLESGKSYQIKAWLVDAASSTKIEGTDVSENKTASGSNGSWDITFNFDGTELGGKTLVAFVEIYDGSNLVLDMKNAGDKNETVLIPGASTELIDQDTKDHTTAEGKSLLIDTITYNNLLPNTTYKIISKIVDKESGETVYETEGEDYRTEDSTSGSFEIKLEFEVETEEPASYVAFEEIQIEAGEEGSGNWVTLIKHEDPEDEAQQTVVPKIKTFARDQKTDYNISFAERYVNIYDVVHYENLEQGQEYTLVSTLMDKDTGEVVYDDSGKEQVIETTFKAEEHLDTGKYGSYGDIIPNNHDGDGITFSLNAESFAGRTLVVFEELFKAGDDGMSPIASETDLENADQTIHFPKIWTNAITDETQTSIALSGDGTSIIKDTISYENVIPGLTYRIMGRVIDKNKTEETGTEVVATGKDGKEARNFVDFTPDSANGSIELSFDIDTSKYADDLKIYNGAVFVVFEEMYVIQKYEGDDAESIVAAHTDITDDTQTIYIPYITTTLLDTKTGLHIMYAESGACLVDTVSYYSCKPGMQFYVSGRLIDMETGKVLRDSAGNEAKIEYQQVTAEGSGDGTWELAYNIDASSIEGATVVAYAEVYIQGGKGEGGYTQVAVHDDFFDREERVYIPHIDTKAYDQDTVNHIAHADGSVYVVDEVTYDNIIPNANYTLESELRWRNADGSDGGRVTDASGRGQFISTPGFSQRNK